MDGVEGTTVLAELSGLLRALIMLLESLFVM